MSTQNIFSDSEQQTINEAKAQVQALLGDEFRADEYESLRAQYQKALEAGALTRDAFGLHPLVTDMQTAVIMFNEIGVSRAALLGLMLTRLAAAGDHRLCTVDIRLRAVYAGMAEGACFRNACKQHGGRKRTQASHCTNLGGVQRNLITNPFLALHLRTRVCTSPRLTDITHSPPSQPALMAARNEVSGMPLMEDAESS